MDLSTLLDFLNRLFALIKKLLGLVPSLAGDDETTDPLDEVSGQDA